MNEKTPKPILNWAFGALMITVFVAVYGFAIGMAKGLAGDHGSWENALAIGAKATAVYLAMIAVLFAVFSISVICKLPAEFRSLLLITLSMAGIHGAQTVINGQSSLFWHESFSGLCIGICISFGVYFAKRKGWVHRI